MMSPASVKSIRVFAALLVTAVTTLAADKVPPPPRVFLLNPETVVRVRIEVRAGTADPKAVAALRREADRALQLAAPSVMDKSSVPPSGDKHDYMSLAPYWWPNPETSNGLPYIRRDGVRNPELNAIPDHKNFGAVTSASNKLALAYYLFGDERYGAKAAELLRVWFIDPRTRMNPNLQFAQAVKGINEGRGTGLIETRNVELLGDTVGLLQGSRAWSAADDRAMRDWCSRFLDWMLTSKNGKEEAAATNNHGMFYDVQVTALALFTGRKELARSVAEAAKTKRIAAQVQPDGSQPRELGRTKSFHYSVFNLSAMFELAALADSAGVDLWSFRTEDRRSIRAALDFLIPYADGSHKWPHQELEPITGKELVPFLIKAADHFHSSAYRQLALELDPGALHQIESLLAGNAKKSVHPWL